MGYRSLSVTLTIVCATVCLYGEKSSWADSGPPLQDVNYGVLVGTWVRTDGGYVIRVGEIKPDGQVVAEYFNPRPIYVDEAIAAKQKEHLKLFIKLQDRGYPGSTYTLYYFAEKDALAGFYYQASMDKTFEVIFLRK